MAGPNVSPPKEQFYLPLYLNVDVAYLQFALCLQQRPQFNDGQRWIVKVPPLNVLQLCGWIGSMKVEDTVCSKQTEASWYQKPFLISTIELVKCKYEITKIKLY